jgi:hypothetical protein
MKKLIPILVVSVLILGSFSAVASSINTKTNDNTIGSQAEIQAEAWCGLGVRVRIKNVGTETFEGSIRCNVSINGLIYGKSKHFNHPNIVLQPGKAVWHILFKIGFSPVTVRLDLDCGQGFISNSSKGFLILYYITGADPITLPYKS